MRSVFEPLDVQDLLEKTLNILQENPIEEMILLLFLQSCAEIIAEIIADFYNTLPISGEGASSHVPPSWVLWF